MRRHPTEGASGDPLLKQRTTVGTPKARKAVCVKECCEECVCSSCDVDQRVSMKVYVIVSVYGRNVSDVRVKRSSSQVSAPVPEERSRSGPRACA